MRITFLPSNNYIYIKQLAFSHKHKDVRKADDITRNSKNVFVLLPSPSYMAMFYKTLDTPQKKMDKLNLNSYAKKFLRIRNSEFFDIEANLTEKDFTRCVMDVLKTIKEEKFGNCCEKALIALAALYANGYDESIAAQLGALVQIKDLETNEVIYEKSYDLDHTTVLTTMNNKQRKEYKNFIVIDPWLGYTGSMADAIGKYKSIYDSKIKDISYETNKICAEKAEEGLDIYNPNAYSTTLQFLFEPTIIPPETSKKEFVEELSKTYPELKLNK